jgi:predicted nucleic acid-binding protein
MILAQAIMYLVDANVISEMRKCVNADKGVQSFFKQVIKENSRVFISVVSVGELCRGVELIRHRGDTSQANRLE